MASAACFASIGEWQNWTYTLSPTMAVAGRDGIWTASSGGIVYYDTLLGTAKVYTNLDSLPGSDIAGIAAMSDGTIWAAGSKGDLSRLRTGLTADWEPMGSYRQSGWTFNSRAITTYGDSLILVGGPQGLSLYSVNQEIALDNVTSFSTLGTQGVHAITVENDTVWVGLDNGAVWAAPDWKRIGKAGNLLADPTQWHVLGTAGTAVTNLFRWSVGGAMTYDSSFHSAMDLSTGLLVAASGNFLWAGTTWTQHSTATYAFPVGAAIGLCIPDTGVVIFHADGTSKRLTAPAGLPSAPVHHIVLQSDESMLTWIGDDLWNLNSTLTSQTMLQTLQSENQLLYKNSTLQRDAAGNLLAATWGKGAWRWSGSAWTQWTDTAAGSCFEPAVAGTHYVVADAVSEPTSKGNWFWWLGQVGADDSLHFSFLPAGASNFTCYAGIYVPPAVPTDGNIIVRSLAAEGDSALWIAHLGGIQRLSIDNVTHSFSAGSVFSMTDASWIMWRDSVLYYAASGDLGFIRRQGTGWKKFSIDSLGASIESQSWRQLAQDTLGNIWASSDRGISVISMSDTAFTLQARLDTSVGLLSNDVYSFSLQRYSGVVAIATDLGVGVYQSSFKKRPDELTASSVHPFPNPFRRYSATSIAFASVTSNSKLYVYAADGTLVEYQTGDAVVGDEFIWKPPSKIRPGLYFWTVQDGSSRAHGRLVISD